MAVNNHAGPVAQRVAVLVLASLIVLAVLRIAFFSVTVKLGGE
jgi:hypothetical protein